MDVAGLVVGVIGLTTLLEACITAFNRVDAFKQYDSTSKQLKTQFKNQKFLLEQWGLCNGIRAQSQHATSTDPPTRMLDHQREERIRETLQCIQEVLDKINSRFAMAETPGATAFARLTLEQRQSATKSTSKTVMPRKPSKLDPVRWAVGGKERLVEQVKCLETFILTLNSITDGPARTQQMSITKVTQYQVAPSVAEVESLRSWLHVTDSAAIRDSCTSCQTEGTCTWLSALPVYRQWLLDSSEHNALWIHAPPGFGKSVIAAALAEALEKAYPHRVLSYFCSASQQQLQAPTNVLRFCIARAISYRPDLFEVAKMLRDESQSQQATETELWSLLTTILKSDPSFIILVDGFDECHHFESNYHERLGSDRGELLQKLYNTISQTSSRLILFSRDEDDIRSALGRSGNTAMTRVAEHCIQPEDVHADIERFASHQVRALEGLSKRNEAFRDKITKHLIKESNGMFLWVRLQSRELADAGPTTAHLQSRMVSMPPRLDIFYERDWQRIQSSGSFGTAYAIKVLQWVLFAVRPFTPLELFEAIAIEDNGSTFELNLDALPEDEIDDTIVQRHLLEPCKPFLVARNGIDNSTPSIQLAHASMKSFLLTKTRDCPDSKLSTIHEARIAKLCAGYLSAGLPWADPEPSNSLVRQHTLLAYVVRNWISHMKRTDTAWIEAAAIVKAWFLKKDSSWLKWRDAFEDYIEAKEPVYFVEEKPYMPEGRAGPCYYAALFGLLDTLQCLITKVDLINAIGGRYGTPLQAACASGYADAVRFLLESGASINIRAGYQGCALNAAVMSGHEDIVDLLLEHGADYTITDHYGRHALYIAAKEGHFKVVERLLNISTTSIDAGRDTLSFEHPAIQDDVAVKRDQLIKWTNASGVTSLNVAAYSGHAKVVKVLLEAGAPHTADHHGWTPLNSAASRGHLEVVKLLVGAGAPHTADRDGWAPLNSAASRGHLEIVELLLSAGAAHTTGEDGWSATYDAAHSGHSEIVKLLLRAGATHSPGANGWTPLNIAAARGHLEVVELLLNARAPHTADDGGWTPLNSAASCGHLEVVKLLLKRDAEHTPNEDGWTPLITAANNGHLKVVEALIEAGAELNAPAIDGSTPITLAAFNGCTEVVELLLDAGANASVCDSHGYTSIMCAAHEGNVEVLQLLLKNSIALDALNQRGESALYLASIGGHDAVLQLLIEHGVQIDAQSSPYGSALQAASYHGDVRAFDVLYRKGADVNARGGDYGTALQAAACRGRTELVQMLLDRGAAINAQGGSYGNACNAAALEGHKDTLELFLKHGAKVDIGIVSKFGKPLLHAAAQEGSCLGIDLALDHGSDIDMLDDALNTALHLAVFEGKVDAVRLLSQRGANTGMCGGAGLSPLEMALDLQDTKVVNLQNNEIIDILLQRVSSNQK